MRNTQNIYVEYLLRGVDDGGKTLNSIQPLSCRERGKKHYCFEAERQRSDTRVARKHRKDAEI